MRLSINHNTIYRYSEPTRQIIQLLRVTPPSFPGQTVLSWRIDLDCDARLREGRDGYGNITHMLYVDKPVQVLTIAVSGRVLTEDVAGVVRGLPNDLPHQVFTRETRLTRAGDALDWLATLIGEEPGTGLDKLHALSSQIYSRMRFAACATEVQTTAEQAFAAGEGVCQDFAHIFIAVARRLGVPARYVSGHLFRRDGDHAQTAAHAWAEAWLEGLGWVAFDPANGISADEAYVRVACGLDYHDAAPVVGARSGGGAEELSVEVSVHQARPQSQWQSQG